MTLASVPAEVDATWWRRHARLVRDRGEHGNLTFTAGTPEEVPPPEVPALAPATDAFAGLVGQEERVRRLRETAEGVRARGTAVPAHAAHRAGGHGQEHAGPRDRRGGRTAAGRGVGAAAQRPGDLPSVPGGPRGGQRGVPRRSARVAAPPARRAARGHGGGTALVGALRRRDGRAASRCGCPPSRWWPRRPTRAPSCRRFGAGSGCGRSWSTTATRSWPTWCAKRRRRWGPRRRTRGRSAWRRPLAGRRARRFGCSIG